MKSRQSIFWAWIMVGLFLTLVSCHNNKKLPEGRFVLFGDYQYGETQSAWKGLRDLKDFRYSDIFYHDNTAATHTELELIEKEIEVRTNLMWVTFPFFNTNEFKGILARHPHQKFAFLDELTYPNNLPQNVTIVEFEMQEAGYIAGYLAGEFSRKKNIAIITQSPSSYQHMMIFGFIAGVMAANPSVRVSYEEIPSFVGPQFVHTIASELADKGTDVIFTVLGYLNKALLDLSAEKNFYLISGNRWDTEGNMWGKNYLGYVARRIDLATFYISNSVLDGRFPAGKVVSYGLADGMVSFVKNPSINVGSGLVKKIENLIPRIILEEIPILLDKERLEKLGQEVKMRYY